jgi:F0F1-type ATP synthase assembly protein I
MSEEGKVVQETPADEEDDRTVNVRLPNPPPAKSVEEEIEEEDRTVNIRVEKLLNDPRMQAMQAKLPDPPKVNLQRPDTETARGTAPKRKATQLGERTASAGSGAMIGFSLVVYIVVGAGLGWLVDKGLGNTGFPWGLVVGFALGTIAGFGFMLRVANKQ